MDWFLYDNGLRHEGVKLYTGDLAILNGYKTSIVDLFLWCSA